MVRPLNPRGKSPWYPFDRRLGGPQSSPDAVEKRKILLLSGIEPRPSIPESVAIPTVLRQYIQFEHVQMHMFALW
jgi:hypothetical protein